MKRIAIIFSIIVSFATAASAQNVLDGVYVREHVPVRQPVQLSYLREADVMWSKKVWRIIDLKEKMNLPFYYPTEKSTIALVSMIFFITLLKKVRLPLISMRNS
ncbi:MAG: hypothetical protein IPK08_19225 [Bacteroidetes bacterium]|nr:hypothetical protein [Bacteroidota bacterium]